MGFARTRRLSSSARCAYGQSQSGLTFAVFVIAQLWQNSAAAQIAAPDLLPGAPGADYGTPGGGLGAGTANLTGLASPFAGVAGLPTTGPKGPALLFQPTVSTGLLFTDNVRQTAVDRTADVELQLAPGLSMLADTPRLQGSLAVSGSINKYAVASDLDTFNGAMFGSGVASIVPNSVFVDARSSLSAASTNGAVGVANVSQLPQSQLTQVFTNTVSPYYRKSFGDIADTELRYRFSSTDFFGAQTFGSSTPFIGPAATPTSFLTPLSGALPVATDSISHEGTVTVASGERFSRLSSRLTLDAAETDARLANSTQLTGYDDVQYRVTDAFSATGRLGYERIRYPDSPSANVSGPTYLIGGQAQFGPRGYLSLQYGRQQGSDGLIGSGHYDITPNTTVSMSITQGTTSTQQQIAGALATAAIGRGGVLINQNTGLPVSLINPQFGLQNVVYRFKTYTAAVTSTIRDNQFTLNANYTTRSGESTVSPPSTTYAVSLGWSRSLTPDLTSSASVAYSTVTNATLGTIAGPGNNNSGYNVNLGLTYIIGYNLTGAATYSFSHQDNPTPGITVATAQSGSVIINQLLFTITKAF